MTSTTKSALNLDAIASTEFGRQTLREIATQRAAKRTTVIDTLTGELAALAKQEREARAEAQLREKKVAELHAAYIAGAELMCEAQRRAMNASSLQDSQRRRARMALGPLGQDVIEVTRHALHNEWVKAATWPLVPSVASFIAAVSGASLTHPIEFAQSEKAVSRLESIKAFVAELDQLEFSGKAPEWIEARCAEMLADCLGKVKEPGTEVRGTTH